MYYTERKVHCLPIHQFNLIFFSVLIFFQITYYAGWMNKKIKICKFEILYFTKNYNIFYSFKGKPSTCALRPGSLSKKKGVI